MTAISLPDDATIRPLGANGAPTLEALVVALFDYAVDLEQDPERNPSGINYFATEIDRENKIYRVTQADIFYVSTENNDGSQTFVYPEYLTGVVWSAGTNPGVWGAVNYLAAIAQAVSRAKKLELNPSKNPTSEQYLSLAWSSETTIGSTKSGTLSIAAELPIDFYGSTYPRPFRGKEYLAN